MVCIERSGVVQRAERCCAVIGVTSAAVWPTRWVLVAVAHPVGASSRAVFSASARCGCVTPTVPGRDNQLSGSFRTRVLYAVLEERTG